MDLASARALKEEIRDNLARRRLATRRSLSGVMAPGLSALPETAPVAPLALGITGALGDFCLAVRVIEAAPGIESLIDEIRVAAAGEVSVRVVGPVVKQQPWHRNRNLSLAIGGSVGHVAIPAGSIGAFPLDLETGGERLILSNNHVLADENRASVGDKILQPGRHDGGLPPLDVVGSLLRFVPLDLAGPNRVDAAVARLAAGVEVESSLLNGLGSLQGLREAPLEAGEIVLKWGRTTGLTRGRVRAFELDHLRVRYDLGPLIFDGQIEIAPLGPGPFGLGPLGAEPFSLAGDSGALVVDEELRAVALLFAGNDQDASYANPIREVLAALRLRL